MEELKNNNKLIILIKGIFISMSITLFMILILSVVLSLTDIKENVIMPSVIFISSFSILIGGVVITKSIGEKGIFYGSILGVLYMSILYIISSIINYNFSLNFNSIIMAVIGAFGGAIGGILGVNLKN